jgi:hypothetical protein
MTARRSFECGSLLTSQLQGIGQLLDRVSMRCASHAALEHADGVNAQPCPLGQFLLRQSGGYPMAFQ